MRDAALSAPFGGICAYLAEELLEVGAVACADNLQGRATLAVCLLQLGGCAVPQEELGDEEMAARCCEMQAGSFLLAAYDVHVRSLLQ